MDDELIKPDLKELPPDVYDVPEEQPEPEAKPHGLEPPLNSGEPNNETPEEKPHGFKKYLKDLTSAGFNRAKVFTGTAIIGTLLVGSYTLSTITRPAPKPLENQAVVDPNVASTYTPTPQDRFSSYQHPSKIKTSQIQPTQYQASGYNSYSATPQQQPQTTKIQQPPGGQNWTWKGNQPTPETSPKFEGFFFTGFNTSTNPTTLSGAGLGQSRSLAGLTTNALIAAAKIQSQTPYETQNQQDQKQQFVQDQHNNGFYSQNQYSAPEEPGQELKAGTLIPAVLMTDIDTDNPGDIIARVVRNVYDTYSEQNLLIPAGSTLIGAYNSSIAFDQNRVQIVWKRLILAGTQDSISLLDTSAVDAAGASGLAGDVDNHYSEIAAAVTAATAFETGADSAVAFLSGLPGMGALGSTLTTNQQTVTQDLSQQIIQKVLNRQPTIVVHAGVSCHVLIEKDIILPILASLAPNE